MRHMSILLALMICLSSTNLAAKTGSQVVYQKDRYKVYKVMEVCKLEITLSKNEQDYHAILSLFNSDNYYNELFTERKRIGLATKEILFAFDSKKAHRISFVPDANAKDSYWHWQYLQESHDLLNLVKKMNEMHVTFSTNKKTFKFTVPLKGSGKAVKALKNCH